MNVVLFGNDLFSAQALQGIVDAGHSVAAIICGGHILSGAAGALRQKAREMNLPVVNDPDPNSVQVRDWLKKTKPEILVSVHLRKLFQPGTCLLATRGGINVHPSLLPKYRGMSPFEQAILHGDEETGITIHYIDALADTGDIILQRRMPISPDIDLFQLQRTMVPEYRQLVPEALRLIGLPDFHAVKQPDESASSYGYITVKDRRISPDWEIKKTDRCIRAFTKPGKGALYEDKVIWRAGFPSPAQQVDLNSCNEPGMVRPGDWLVIKGKDGFLISDDFDFAERKS